MPSFIPEEVSHCWDLWRYPGCGAINRVCFPLTKTCQRSSSLTWICFFAWRLRKCLCPLSAEMSLSFWHWFLCSLLGIYFWTWLTFLIFFFSSITPLPGHLSLPPLPFLLLQVSVFLRYSDCYCLLVSAHPIPIQLPLYVLHAVCASCFGRMDFSEAFLWSQNCCLAFPSLGLVLHSHAAFKLCKTQLYK